MRKEFIFRYKNKNYNMTQICHILDSFSNIETELDNLEMAVCIECGRVLDKDMICCDHNNFEFRICKDCCEECQEARNYSNWVNSQIDGMRGK